MQPNKNPYKKILILLILLVIGAGIYFGIYFYQTSKKAQTRATITDPKTGKTAFQARTASTTDQPQIGILQDENPATINTASSVPNVTSRLVQLWDQPVSGFDFIYKDIEITSTSTVTTSIPSVATNTPRIIDEKPAVVQTNKATVFKKTILKNQEFIYFWDRKTGHIYENLSSTTERVRISNYTLPRMEEVFFIDNISVLARGLSSNNESINSLLINLYKETATSTLYSTKIKPLNFSSKQISVLPEVKKVFHFINNTGKGTLTSVDGTNQTTILNTTITELIPQYINKSVAAVTTRPSAYFPGYMFLVSTDGSGTNEYILGDKYALGTLVSPDGKKILFSEIEQNQLRTAVYDIRSKTTVELSQATLPEKCAWDNTSTLLYCGIPQKLAQLPYPDAWYQNQTQFTDNMWTVNPLTGEFKAIIPLQDQVSVPIDVINIKVSKNKKYLLFQDRYSLTLWKYEL